MGGLKLLHKAILKHKPKAITQYIKQSMISVDNCRMVRHNFIQRKPKSNKTSNSFFYRSIKHYNSLPIEVKILEPKVFNKKIKEYIRKIFRPDMIP